MNQEVFKEYMDKELIQKTTIFADTLGLSIDGWQAPKEGSAFSNRVYLYEKDHIVGYLDVDYDVIGENIIFIKSFPVKLYTPVGIVKGAFNNSKSSEEFSYKIESPTKDTIVEIEGGAKINNNHIHDSYDFSAFIEFKDNSDDKYRISFNNYIGYGTLHISKNDGLEDLFINVNSDYYISHKSNVVKGVYKDKNEVKVRNTGYFSPVIANFDFNDFPSYQKFVTLEDEESDPFKFDTTVDLEKVNTEIKLHDPRIFELIEVIRELLTFSKDKKTFSIYDKLSYHCLHNTENKIIESLINDKDVSEEFENNQALQKMPNNQKKTSN